MQSPDASGSRSGTPAERDSGETDLTSILLALWLGKWWILLCVSLALVGGVFQVMNTPRSYQADALIQIEPRGSMIALPESMRGTPGNDNRTVTEIEIIRSRLVLGQAVSDVNFDWQWSVVNPPLAGEFLVNAARRSRALADALNVLPGVERLEIELLQVPPQWLGRAILLTAQDEGRFRLELPDRSILTAAVGEMLGSSRHGFALKLSALRALPERQFVLWQRDELSSISAMRSGLTVAEDARGSGILRLRYVGLSPDAAERVLGAITRAYVRQNVGRSAAEAENGLTFIRAQLPAAQTALQDAEEALNRYRRQQQSIDLSFETQALLTQSRAIEAELVELQAREEEVKVRYRPSHPVYQQLLLHRQRLRDRLQALQTEAEALPSTQREMLSLTREVEIAQATYTQLLTRAQELGVMSASSVGSARLIDAARAQALPVGPRSALILSIAAGLGLVLGAALVGLLNWLRRGIESPKQLEEIGLPVFGIVGYSTKAQRLRARRQYRILAQSDPTDLTTEAFRSLRTSLRFGLASGSNRAVALTSTHPSAGKSFISSNLAYVAADAGLRVCLIDADLRRGYLRRYFDLPAEAVGLSEYLAGVATLQEVQHATAIPGLTVISTGQYPPNPSELLMRPALAECVRALSEDHDLILLDTPPAVMLTDATLIAGVADAALFVVRHGVTRADELQHAIRHFEQAGLRVTGSILNFFNPKKTSAGNYYRYSAYGYGYAYRAKSSP